MPGEGEELYVLFYHTKNTKLLSISAESQNQHGLESDISVVLFL